MSKLASRLEEWRAKQADIAQGKIEAPKKFKTAKRPAKSRATSGAKAASAPSPGPVQDAEPAQPAQATCSGSMAVAAAAAAAAASKAAAPAAQQLKQALDALRQKRQPMTAQQLEAACGFSATPGSLLAAALAGSDRVEVSSAGDYTYQARHELHNAQELLHFLTSRPEGTHMAEVRDAYDGLEADATKLAARGKILAWRSTETDELVLYPKTVPGMPSMQVDADIVREWLAIKLPAAAGGLEEALRKAGLTAVPRKAKRRPPPTSAKDKKRKQNRAMRVATNLHMPELFAGPMATRIE